MLKTWILDVWYPGSNGSVSPGASSATKSPLKCWYHNYRHVDLYLYLYLWMGNSGAVQCPCISTSTLHKKSSSLGAGYNFATTFYNLYYNIYIFFITILPPPFATIWKIWQIWFRAKISLGIGNLKSTLIVFQSPQTFKTLCNLLKKTCSTFFWPELCLSLRDPLVQVGQFPGLADTQPEWSDGDDDQYTVSRSQLKSVESQ